MLWNIAFSPYSNTERLFAMYGIVVCLVGLRTIRREPEPVRSGPALAAR
jgi:hypothetical protein